MYCNPTSNGYVRYDFFDPYSRYTFTYILYTNFKNDAITATDTALYETYYVKDAEGGAVVLENSRAVNISRSENTDALGVHNVKFAVVDGKVTITVDNARATTIAESFGTFNLEASILTIETPASATDAEMQVALKEYGPEDTIDYETIKLKDDEPDNPGESENPGESKDPSESQNPSESEKPGESNPSESEKPNESKNPSDSEKPSESKSGGCFGGIAAGAIMLPALAAAFFIIKKKEDKE